eukprot:14647525-Alexandrium_andersonii.AAC.1
MGTELWAKMLFPLQRGAPRSGDPSRSVKAPSSIAWRPLGGGSEGAPVSLCGGGPSLAHGAARPR